MFRKSSSFICVLMMCHLHIGSEGKNLETNLKTEDMKFFFGHPPPANHRIINIQSKSRHTRSINPDHIEITLEDENGKMDLDLHPNNDLISPHFRRVVRGKDGKIESETSETVMTAKKCIFMGNAKGKESTTAVALSTCDGEGYTGILIDGEHSHIIRPLNASMKSRSKRETDNEITEDGLHIIYARDSDSKCAIHNLQAMRAPPREIIKLSPENLAENIWSSFSDNEEDEVGGTSEHFRARRQTRQRFVIETGVFTDEMMYEVTKENNVDATDEEVLEKLESIVLAIMNGVNIIYNGPSIRTSIRVELSWLELMKSSKSLINDGGGEISSYLSNFCLWQHITNKDLLRNKKGGWDHGLLLSGIDMWDNVPSNDKVIGLAWVGGMCNSLFSCTINEGTSFESQFVIAHEMGHNLDMSHDGSKDDGNTCLNNTYIMSPSTGPGKLSWSVCSNRELEDFLEMGSGSCLQSDVGSRNPKKRRTQDQLPGEKFNLDGQCKYAMGTLFRPYVTSTNPYDNVCRELWCQNDTHAMRTHPALEGSKCSEQKHCITGLCVRKLQIPSGSPPQTSNDIPQSKPESNNDGRGSSSFGFRDFLGKIRNLFKKYFLISSNTNQFINLNDWRLEKLTSCSVTCGGGWKTGNIVCVNLANRTRVTHDNCDDATKPPPKTSCNTLPCTGTKFT